MQVGGSEPAFDAPAKEVAAFFASRDRPLFAVGSYLSVLGLAAFVWFLGGLWATLTNVEGEPAWRSMIVLMSGVAFVAGVGNNGWELAAFRANDGLDPQLARFAFDMGNLSLASSWVALSSLSLASGWIMLAPRRCPRWLAYWAFMAGVGLLVARAIWTTAFWFFPYALFWLWVLIISARLIGSGRGRDDTELLEHA